LKKYFLLGFISGIIFWAISVSWIYSAINFYGAGDLISFLISSLLILYLSLYSGLFFSGIYLFKESDFRWLILPSLFYFLEWIKSWMISGFPWLNLGIIFDKLWGALPLVGISGTSFIIAMIVCLLFERNLFLKLGLSAALSILLLFGPGHYQEIDGESLDVTVIQPGDNDFEKIIDLTNQAEHDLVVWPEAVTWYDKSISKIFENKIVIGGFFTSIDEQVYASLVNITDGHTYNKRNLVPFGEFQPFGSLLKGFNAFFNIPNSNISKGKLNQKKSYWSGLICWELAFNETFVSRVKDTSFIIHSSNDSWYGKEMPEQHLKLARARAVESNKWVVRSTTDGMSQIISPKKDKSSKILKRGEVGSISSEIKLNEKNTLYLIYGDFPLLITCLVILLLATLQKNKIVMED
tara:strand:+ start:217 stop:1440 length:1224 start_codon:yes stop_codon:yes gene_type:complete